MLTRHDGQGILKIRGSLRYQSGGWIDGPVYKTKYILFSASGYRDIVGIVFCSGTNQGRVNRCRRANAA